MFSTPESYTVSEDDSVSLTGVNITDADVDRTEHGTIGVTLSVDHGTLSVGEIDEMTYATGDGIDDEMMRFVGTLKEVNRALESFSYKPHPDYHGMEEVQIRVTDQAFTGTARASSNNDSAAAAAEETSRSFNVSARP